MPLHKMAQYPVQSDLVRDTFHPVFNQNFSFTYLSKHEMLEQKLYIHLYYYNRVSKRDGIGTVQINLSNIWGLTVGKECCFWEKIKWLRRVSIEKKLVRKEVRETTDLLDYRTVR